ncbi:sarcosine oxidase subunit delta [Streptomyces phyllanthi]|uniref:Uncharacterized protein n=1 Tax=Streptomyces phyllanthi TaxID=1803180 RepID=A0A5N8VVG5_9ACTN|nr:sarcosine oxidase subunit delta [Streptomyces phyllanthi]MPY39263.1 hypothetical protein [Streptomyces phyllanthi]
MQPIARPWCGEREEAEPFAERWTHTAGCRRWFNTLRDAVTHRLLAVHRMGDQPALLRPLHDGVAGRPGHGVRRWPG